MFPTIIFKLFIATAVIAPVISLPIPAGGGGTPSPTHARWVHVRKYFTDISDFTLWHCSSSGQYYDDSLFWWVYISICSMIFADIYDFAIRARPPTPNFMDLWVYVNGLRAVTIIIFLLRFSPNPNLNTMSVYLQWSQGCHIFYFLFRHTIVNTAASSPAEDHDPTNLWVYIQWPHSHGYKFHAPS